MHFKKVICAGLPGLQRFLDARDRGAPDAELLELKMAARMSTRAAEIGERNGSAIPDRSRGDRGVSSLAEARAIVRARLLDHARDAMKSAGNEDELRAALRIRDRALGHDTE